MPTQRFLTLANALSMLRIFIALPTAWAITQSYWSLASFLLLLAIISDLTDGPIARKLGETSAMGGLLDHSCDAIYIVSALAALAAIGSLPVLLPILVVLAFFQYVLDSKALQGRLLRTNKLGRYNGIAYFVLLAVALWGVYIIPGDLRIPVINTLAWILIVSTLLSMLDRLWAVLHQDASQ